jgi:hypothetical protein
LINIARADRPNHAIETRCRSFRGAEPDSIRLDVLKPILDRFDTVIDVDSLMDRIRKAARE